MARGAGALRVVTHEHIPAGRGLRVPAPPLHTAFKSPPRNPSNSTFGDFLMSIANARTTAQRAAAPREIAFVDPGIADLGDLLRGLRAEVHAVVLCPAGDPVRQMADALDECDALQAIHIIAHGM